MSYHQNSCKATKRDPLQPYWLKQRLLLQSLYKFSCRTIPEQLQ